MTSRCPRRSFVALSFPGALLMAFAVNAAEPTSVTVPADFQSELGCPGDWQPDCSLTHLDFDAEDAVWQGTFVVPAGSWGYKAALNDSWTENYGANATRDGATIPLSVLAGTDVKFYYSHETHWITDNVSSVIAVAPGSFQSELGCAGDWDPGCLRSWLQDPDGDGVFTLTTNGLPAGSYEVKVAIGESWDENYGAGGVQNGANISFTVPSDCAAMLFSFDWATKVLTVGPAPPPPQPASVTAAGSFQSELGCPGDWQPDCALTHLAFDAGDAVWQGTFAVPAGSWEYKGALNDTWDVNYGANATENGPNISLSLAAPIDVKFYYSHATHWVTDDVDSVIAVAPGSFQSELGCPGDWDPGCLRSWLQDPDGDGIYTFATSGLPAGAYEAKVAIDESWDENYGAGGVQNGPNIPFIVPSSCAEIVFSYDASTHILTVGGAVPPTATSTTLGSSANPSTFGSLVTFTATVSPAGATGSVSFLEGATLLGTGTLTAGAASFTTSSLTVGGHSVTAAYGGDATHAASTSPALAQTVDAIPTTVALASSVNPSVLGDPVTFTATVSPTGATGSVSFLEGATLLGTGTLAAGSATFTSSSLAVGGHSVTAAYGGNATHAASTSPAVVQVVDAIPTTVTLLLPPVVARVGQPVPFGAVVSPSSATGLVDFLVNGNHVATAPVINGTASAEVTFDEPVSGPALAMYSGDAGHAPSTSEAVALVVQQAAIPTLSHAALGLLALLLLAAGTLALRRS